MISSYGVKIKIEGFGFAEAPQGVSLNCLESIYGGSTYDLEFYFQNFKQINPLIEAIDKNNTATISWNQRVNNEDLISSEDRVVEIIKYSFGFNLNSYSLCLTCTDKLFWMQRVASQKVYQDYTLKEILEEIIKNYEGLELDTDVDESKTWTLAQAGNSDYSFIKDILIPRASQCVFERGDGEKIPCSYLFYVDKGKKLVVKTRQPIKGEKEEPKKITLKRNYKGKDERFLSNFTFTSEIDSRHFYIDGEGIDFLKSPWEVKSFQAGNEDGLKLVYDSISKEQAFYNKGPAGFHNIPIDNLKKDTNIENIIKGRMVKPSLFSKYKMSVVTNPDMLVSAGMEAEVIPIVNNELLYKGIWIIYAFRTMIDPASGAWTAYYLERAKNE